VKKIYDGNGAQITGSALTSILTTLTTANDLFVTDLFQFTMRDGSFDYFTSLDVPVVYAGNTYKANSLQIEGLRLQLSIGVKVDEQDIRIAALPTDTLTGANFFTSVEEGLLDGAYLTRSKAFWIPLTGLPFKDFLNKPDAVIPIYVGRVASIDKIGRTQVEMKLRSPLSLLDTDMPRNTYQPACQWTLYDTGCGLARGPFTSSFTVISATKTDIIVSSVSPVLGADGLAYYQQGRLLFTSGINNNLQTIISGNGASDFALQYPLLTPPNPGDTFTASAGCSKMSNTCSSKFANLQNFRAFPRVPPIVISV
jgi:uncharacterized phage protein (TIGR02218 family)